MPPRFLLITTLLGALAGAGAAGACSPAQERALAGEAVGDEAGEPCWGAVAEMSIHAPSGVLSMWLANNVRAHHRRMTERPGEVTVVVTIAGGQIEETHETRGLTEAGVVALRTLSTRTVGAAAMSERLRAHKIKLRARDERDSVMIVAQFHRDDLSAAGAALAALLTEPRIDAEAFESWRSGAERAGAPARAAMFEALRESLVDALYPPDEPRARGLDAAERRGVERESAQEWLDALLQRAPIEAAIVGDIGRAEAIEALRAVFGELPPRARITPDPHAALRDVRRVLGPHERTVVVDARGGEALVLVGYVGVDASDTEAHRRLALGAKVLWSRLSRVYGEESTNAWSVPAEAYSGFGLFYAMLHVPASDAREAALHARETLEAMARDGIDENELGAARARLSAFFEEIEAEPAHWAYRLAGHDQRGRDTDAFMGEREALARVTTEEVAAALRDVLRDEARLSFVVTPAKE
ncbi:MAG: insulinase family protein [Phycisphaerales bacterium]|nr:MAG: insulinase family protein [Phycisphaerales bacterium]